MSGEIVAAASAETFLVKKAIVEDLKADALELASAYAGNVKIQVDVNHVSGNRIAQVTVTEYNL